MKEQQTQLEEQQTQLEKELEEVWSSHEEVQKESESVRLVLFILCEPWILRIWGDMYSFTKRSTHNKRKCTNSSTKSKRLSIEITPSKKKTASQPITPRA